MRVQDVRKIICVLFMFGFVAGIIYINIFAKPWILSIGIFSDYFLEQYNGNKLNTAEYMWYIIKLRVLPVIFAAVPANINFKRFFAIIFVMWTGFSSGLILTISVVKLGLKGLGLCLIGGLPHFICYITAYIIVLIYLFSYPNVKWSQTKTISLILFELFGIVTEVYINPVLMEIYIGVL